MTASNGTQFCRLSPPSWTRVFAKTHKAWAWGRRGGGPGLLGVVKAPAAARAPARGRARGASTALGPRRSARAAAAWSPPPALCADAAHASARPCEVGPAPESRWSQKKGQRSGWAEAEARRGRGNRTPALARPLRCGQAGL